MADDDMNNNDNQAPVGGDMTGDDMNAPDETHNDENMDNNPEEGEGGSGDDDMGGA
jgi:hypothetical protein